MKIAIQGHSKRGKEVIQILESLGGKNEYDQLGSNERFVYFINNIGCIYSVTPQMCSNERKIYTLEEFEKEFPFKVGDRVISATTNFIGTITDLEEGGCYYIKYDNGNLTCAFGQNLKPYKEMKEERNITLTLDKAKEWYNKGGELKEIALQAFTERELNPLPRSWEEFCRDNPVKTSEAVICTESTIVTCDYSEIRDSDCDREICPSQKSAEAHLALIQLEQLRDCWWGDWEPDWCDNIAKYAIKKRIDKSTIERIYVTHAFLSFPTYELALEFLECFRDLIEKAGDLI